VCKSFSFYTIEVPVSSPNRQQGFLFWVHSTLTQKLRKKVAFMSFRSCWSWGPSSFLLQAHISHHCGKPTRGNKNKNKSNSVHVLLLYSYPIQVKGCTFAANRIKIIETVKPDTFKKFKQHCFQVSGKV